MAKPLDPKAIEAERQTSSRAERREQKRRQMQDEISYNQRGNGVIVIPPQNGEKLQRNHPNSALRHIAASARRRNNRSAVSICRFIILPRELKPIRNGNWWKSIKMRESVPLLLKTAGISEDDCRRGGRKN